MSCVSYIKTAPLKNIIWWFWLITITGPLVWSQGEQAASSMGKGKGKDKAPRLLIINPVNLATFAVLPVMSDQLRSVFNKTGGWEVIPYTAIQKKYSEYSIDINKPCKEFTCAYDAGSVMLADFSLYSTVTRIQDVYIYNLNLIDVSTTKVVWSKVGEVPIKSTGVSTEALMHRFTNLIEDINIKEFSTDKMQSKGLLGILDLSTPTEYSHILFERLSTHAYTSGQYDLIGQTELNFLVDALNIKVTELIPNRANMIPLGEKLGLDYLIYSKLSNDDKNFKLKLALFDIQKKKLIREWPYESNTYRKLLKFEDKFFSTLQKIEESQPSGDSKSSSSIAGGVKWKYIISGVFLVSSGIATWQAFVENSKIEDAVAERDAAPHIGIYNEAVKKAEDAQKSRNIMSILGGVTFAVSIVSLTF